MSAVLIGNILCFIAATIMMLMGMIKDRIKFIQAQSMMNIVYIAAYSFLRGTSGIIVNIVTLTRNIVCLKWKMTTPIKLAFILVQVALGVFFGTHGLVAWFPVIACSIFTLYMDCEDAVKLRCVIIGTQILFIFYDWSVRAYTGFAFDILATITNTISLIRLIQDSKRTRAEIDNMENQHE